MNQIPGLSERLHWSFVLSKCLRMALLAGCLLPALAPAVNVAVRESASTGIEKLLKEGRYGEAEKEIRHAQSLDAENPRLKFLHCVLQVQQTSAKKAISCFQQLVQENPAVPEAYNNIGVLYAGMGMHIEARKWFERGLKQQPAYAALHQNLMNLQAEMNRSAYSAALQLDMSKTSAQPKLSLLGHMTSNSDMPVAAVAVASASSAGKPTPAAGLPEPVAAKSAVTEKTVVASPQAVARPSDAAGASGPESRVREVVLAWALAWSQKDLDAYLKAYSPHFNPGSNLSRSDWEDQRRSRIVSKKQIRIELSKLKISFSNTNSKATATFIQSYESGAIVTVSRKTLELSQDKGNWLITREYVSGS